MEEILDRIAGLGPGRRVLAVLGAPGSGKSTLAAQLAAGLDDAVLVPMDGFHLDNRLLEADGRRGCKGAPETFDAAGFVALVQRLKAGGEVIHPIFDRALDLAIAGAGRVEAETRLVVVEGNYLLLDRDPWRELAGLWDLSVMLDVPMEELRRRLTARWQGLGRSPAEVMAHLENDLGNAELVLRESLPADLVVRPGPISSAETP
ncbi:fructose transporter kinase [Paracoccus denitrificans]|jgi:pantothenate kinase|uniref:Fructokinase n=1 Tax=Paracoccus denitrificans (strain Pd 1222) TaxID=318586 RepID=A1AZC0_PARDP|nr:fructose transporter kinase [Paracoccus denitrificans]ABL68614.1 fructokinase [Paracoccus denitrificans PD1222]MBB4625662.1 pantothenate kinase [Paracoccus denitrificans]MCU7427169.1 nucleoside/nucleotide kinase family protein [Paracoccus denitrificans]QAR26672.1 nucleoside/nucleotide kinase family protein [Paracoccus denitrificans]UPV95621.1 nucleoside/nucleotide kinase family protein [Paracoccus denitrificans]